MSDWVSLKEYAMMFEAELDKQALEHSDIPVMLQGPLTGAFGPGFAGATAQGVTLFVPGDRYDEAIALLADDEA